VRDSPRVQVFGLDDNQATRAAIRFFKERRIELHVVDLRRKPISRGELRRFADRLGAASLLDSDGRAYREAGLGFMRMDDDEIGERLRADVRLLRLPLVRFGNEMTVGRAESTWRDWLAGASSKEDS
jgi:arsenate reductase (glutaredoxin)